MFDLREFRELNGLKPREIVETLRPVYPGYDKTVNSKVENPEKYGIRLIEDAEEMVKAIPSKSPEMPLKTVRVAKQYQLRCSMSKTKRDVLQQAFRRHGLMSLQAGVTYLVDRFLEEVKDD